LLIGDIKTSLKGMQPCQKRWDRANLES
jgi:hypothetical protein